jgi:acetyltransferase-like isoleucine patch superfamily enzyme
MQTGMSAVQRVWRGFSATKSRTVAKVSTLRFYRPDTKLSLHKSIIGDKRPLPPANSDPKEDEALFEDTDPFVDGPISVDHGLNFRVGKGTFLNFNLLVLDTCRITIGENVLFGPNVCLYGAIHPIDPAVRRGVKGPEAGKEIHIEDDVWIGGSALILGGVRIGRGSTVGAGSVVTKVSLHHDFSGCSSSIMLKNPFRMSLHSTLRRETRHESYGTS